jgi:hypothetical protein
MARVDLKAQEAVTYLPQDGTFITYDDWKRRLIEAQRNDLVRATRNAKLQGLANFVVSEYEPGVLTLEVAKVITGEPMPRAATLRTATPPTRLTPKGDA